MGGGDEWVVCLEHAGVAIEEEEGGWVGGWVGEERKCVCVRADRFFLLLFVFVDWLGCLLLACI